MTRKRNTEQLLKFVLLLIFSIVIMYPLLWMIVSSFKPEEDIFKHIGLIPRKVTIENYFIGWKSNGKVTFSKYFANSI